MKATLYRADLRYPHLQLYTASSGSIAGLEELYLLLEDKAVSGLGEVRINIAYLNGYSAEQVLGDVIRALQRLDLQQSPSALLLKLETLLAESLAPTRMLFDMALHDLIARQNGCSVARLMGSDFPEPVCYATNQTLFWTSQEQMLSQASAYMDRGFTHLKLRVGIGSLVEDLDRMTALRRRFGHDVHLSADANGQWRPEQARINLLAMQKFELSYLEQPISDANAHLYPQLAADSPIPLMLDESMSCEEDLERILAMDGAVWAHIKLVKMGGIAPAVRAARRLNAAGIPFMIGQMNEGAAATAAALHVAHACQPAHAELYGADGIANDPVSGLSYSQGLLTSGSSCGLGVEFDPTQAELIQTFSS